ncbi:hypothetical protein JCM5353_004584 [Sporobolomyces roseus]
MLSTVALPLAVAALSSVSSVAAFQPAHGHAARSLNSHHSFKRFVAPIDKVSRMVKRVKRGTDKTYSTTAIWYAETGWVGSCGESFTDDDLIIALPIELYPKFDEVSYLCGEKVTVTNDATGASITATVADASQRGDYTIFTKAGYEKLGGDLDQGELSVTYKFANSSPHVSSALPESFSTSAAAGASEPQSTVKVTSSATAAAVVTSAAKKLAVVATTTSRSTTSFAPAATASPSPSASASSSEEDDEDWICEDVAEDESSDDSSSSDSYEEKDDSSWEATSSAAAQTTTQAPKATTTTSQAPQPTTTSSSAKAQTTKVYDSGSSDLSLLSTAGVKSFLGTNTNAIASWYHANSGQDSTNGNSWCYFPYKDSSPGLAISVGTMRKNFPGDEMAARKAYCGLEVEVTTPDGKSMILAVIDGFDDAWVKTPASVDIMYDSFTELFGKQTSNKNDVITNVSWKFTGTRNEQYRFDGPGN